MLSCSGKMRDKLKSLSLAFSGALASVLDKEALLAEEGVPVTLLLERRRVKGLRV